MKKFTQLNNILGWAVFMVSAFVYLSTIESTASFWDCGEFISAAFKLEVGHPPGAPFFLLLARFFAMFATDTSTVALMVNAMSGLASAFTIMFLFWTITFFARRIYKETDNFSTAQLITIFGSGVVGALAFTFSDTFWFSAVEGEVYATSSLFTAIVFWAILKWDNAYGTKYANRWLVLIAYLMGLSIGVHLLNLLAIPAIVMVIYFRRYTPTKKGVIIALSTSVIILASIMYLIIPGFVKVASWFELLFINGFGMPYNSGVIFYVILVIALIIIGVRITLKRNMYIANTAMILLTVILMGYASYALIFIRSNANPPMDQNSPDNVFSLMYYLNREQYGNRPLVTGQSFASPAVSKTEKKGVYGKRNGKYEIVDHTYNYIYHPETTSLFPRMYSNSDSHISAYKQWSGFKGKIVVLKDVNGQTQRVRIPTFGENLKFFFKYQIGHMYFRYFMWNFAGRQNDIQGHGDFRNGNWISGINFIDEARLGPQDSLTKKDLNNKSRNKYYMLPFLLGLFGMVFQFSQKKTDFWVVTLMFVLTGLAIVVYLNQYPYQPRERDYAYVGSFYAFAIWIGLGIAGLIESFKSKKGKTIIAGSITAITFVAVPVNMAAQNWDDHDRSGRNLVIDIARNYLETCEPNSVLFTYGDNDTFPLWYAQEVEGVRTDVRVSNLSYLGADWYINQMKCKAYNSEALDVQMTNDKYAAGVRDAVLIIDKIKPGVDLKKCINFVLDDDRRTKTESPFEEGETIDFFPTKTFTIPVDKQKLLNNKTISLSEINEVVDTFKFRNSANYLMKNELFVYDLISKNEWNRPIYFAITVGRDNYFGMDKYMRLEGLASRLVPIKGEKKGLYSNMNAEVMYNKFMNKFTLQDFTKGDVYLDSYASDLLSNFRSIYSSLATELIEKGDDAKAINVINKLNKLFPPNIIPLTVYDLSLIENSYTVGLNDIAEQMTNIMFDNIKDNVKYYLSLPNNLAESVKRDQTTDIQVLMELVRLAQENKNIKLADKLTTEYQAIIKDI